MNDAAIGKRDTQTINVRNGRGLANWLKKRCEISARAAQMRHQGGACFNREVFKPVTEGKRKRIAGGNV